MTKGMHQLLKLEEAGQFLLSIWIFNQLDYAWWLFPALILLPDLSMIGYLFGTKTGARLYNLFHHKLMAIVLLIAGFWWHYPWLAMAGVILFGHSSMDRMLGYGLKYDDGFHHTHLGKIGKKP